MQAACSLAQGTLPMKRAEEQSGAAYLVNGAANLGLSAVFRRVIDVAIASLA